MQSLSLAFLPFFVLPIHIATTPATTTAPVTERTVASAPRSTSRASEPTPATRIAPAVPVGHRAAPSGCDEAVVPSYTSLSYGTPTRGRLSDAQFLGESEFVHHVDAQNCNFWGTDELVGVVGRVARKVAAENPGVRLTVGELSQEEGGDIVGHSSHENGRDVDFGFYWVDEDGLPYEPSRLINVRADKTAVVDGKTLTFDVARNWKIIEALLTDEEADLNIALINVRIRRWLLDYARESGVSDDLRHRASVVMRVPKRGAHPHLNHFHVRIYCPEDDGQCRDFNGLWDWVADARAERAEASDALARAEQPAETLARR